MTLRVAVVTHGRGLVGALSAEVAFLLTDKAEAGALGGGAVTGEVAEFVAVEALVVAAKQN